MNTPTHTLLALAIMSKGKGHEQPTAARNWAVILGSLIPDIIIYIWAPYQSFVNGISGRELWRELYFAPTMQLLIAPPNSVPIMLSIALLGWLVRTFTSYRTTGLCLLMFALAALIHIATDFPVHGHDAYRHFWPLTDWRFHSEFSYWQRSQGAGWVSLIEMAIGLICIGVLWRRFPRLWVKAALLLLALSYIAMQMMVRLGPF